MHEQYIILEVLPRLKKDLKSFKYQKIWADHETEPTQEKVPFQVQFPWELKITESYEWFYVAQNQNPFTFKQTIANQKNIAYGNLI